MHTLIFIPWTGSATDKDGSESAHDHGKAA